LEEIFWDSYNDKCTKRYFRNLKETDPLLTPAVIKELLNLVDKEEDLISKLKDVLVSMDISKKIF
jgi:hypothetical protein